MEAINFEADIPIVSVDDLSAESSDPVWNERAQKFVTETYLYQPDGNSLERLKNTFEALCK
jgi:hypothetical protein